MAVEAPNERIKKKSLFQNYPEAYASAQEAIGQGVHRYALLKQMHQI
jgi:hypothetical protein